ncbi:MAG: hypothetical protein ACTSQZ_05135, partial [Candidatus Thorarchaeota archaeon]
MNVVRKGGRIGTINEVRKKFRKKKVQRDLSFDVGKLPRDILDKMLVICGKVGKDNIDQYQAKANELGADFVVETGSSWVLTRKTVRENYDHAHHKGVLLIGSNKELP